MAVSGGERGEGRGYLEDLVEDVELSRGHLRGEETAPHSGEEVECFLWGGTLTGALQREIISSTEEAIDGICAGEEGRGSGGIHSAIDGAGASRRS